MRDNSKLVKDEKIQILKWIAEFEPVSAIKQKVLDYFDKEITVQNIYSYRDRYSDEVAKMRSHFLGAVMEIPIANKAVRLKYRQELVERLLSEGGTDSFGTINRILDSVAREFDERKYEYNEQYIQGNLVAIADSFLKAMK